jgi:dihydrofolate synthase/folylpolyglutamate synthase
VLDGAHNPGAIGELVKAVKKAFSYNHLILVLGVMADKDITKIINKIAPIADYVVCTAPDYYRSADPEDLMAIVSRQGRQGEVVPRISKAIDMAREMARPGDMILITGSLFTVGEALSCLDPVKYRPDVVTQ